MSTHPSARRSFVTAALIFAAVVPALAHEGHHHNAMGTIRTVQANQLDLETTEGKVEVFVLTDTTSYKRGDSAAKREDLEVGARAVVMYEAKDGKNLAIEIKLGASEHEGHGSHAAATPALSAAPAAPAAFISKEDFNALHRVEARFVCMGNNSLLDVPQIPVEVGGKTYFGCCPACKERLETHLSLRESMDPISRRMVDKAVAVIGVLPSGTVVYFETEQNLVAYRAKLTGRQPS
ncbi:MAG: hypothetical protein U0X73_16215 [Thermoanaerobaculia bacterium]